MVLRTIVVDDEELGRRGVVSRLEKSGAAEVVAECASGPEALDAVRRLRPDLLFLDVQMPGLDGFEFLRALGPEERPYVIFVTAHVRHALRAFDVEALDYVVKPIQDERFEQALRRAAERIRRDRDGDLGRRVRAALGAGPGVGRDPPAPLSNRYPVRDRGKVVFVRHAEIDWVSAEGDYVRLHAGARDWLVRDTLGSVERRLGRRRFLRIHRSTLVNVDRIAEMRCFDNGDAAVVLRDGTELRMSRTHREAVDRLIGRS